MDTSLKFKDVPEYTPIYTNKKKTFLTIINNNPKFFGLLFLILILVIGYFIFFQKSDFELRQEVLRQIYENPKPILLDFKKSYKKEIKKIQVSWQEDMTMPDWEDLSLLSTNQLIALFERVEATGNRLLVDMIREVLLARWSQGENFDFKKIIPSGVYTVVVVSTEFGWGVSIVESEELFQQVAHSPFYAGATNVYIKTDGKFEMQETTFINSHMVGISRQIIEAIAQAFLREIGYQNVGEPVWLPRVLPDVKPFSQN